MHLALVLTTAVAASPNAPLAQKAQDHVGAIRASLATVEALVETARAQRVDAGLDCASRRLEELQRASAAAEKAAQALRAGGDVDSMEAQYGRVATSRSKADRLRGEASACFPSEVAARLASSVDAAAKGNGKGKGKGGAQPSKGAKGDARENEAADGADAGGEKVASAEEDGGVLKQRGEEHRSPADQDGGSAQPAAGGLKSGAGEASPDPVLSVAPVEVSGGTELLRRAGDHVSRIRSAVGKVLSKVEGARNEKDIVKLNCVSEKLQQIKQILGTAQGAETELQESLTRDSGQADVHYSRIAMARGKADQLGAEAEECTGQLALVVDAKTEVDVQLPENLPNVGVADVTAFGPIITNEEQGSGTTTSATTSLDGLGSGGFSGGSSSAGASAPPPPPPPLIRPPPASAY